MIVINVKFCVQGFDCFLIHQNSLFEYNNLDMQSNDIRLKVVFTGESSVGKTTLISWQVDKKFHFHEATIGFDFKKKDYQIGAKTVRTLLWDTVGGERSKFLKNPLFRNSHAVCLCFCLNNRYSFERLPVFIKTLKFNEVECPMFLVGCKADLEHVVPLEEIKEYASKEGTTYFETSAKQQVGVNDNIQKVIQTAYEYYQANPHVQTKPLNRASHQPGFCWS